MRCALVLTVYSNVILFIIVQNVMLWNTVSHVSFAHKVYKNWRNYTKLSIIFLGRSGAPPTLFSQTMILPPMLMTIHIWYPTHKLFQRSLKCGYRPRVKVYNIDHLKSNFNFVYVRQMMTSILNGWHSAN